MNRDLHFATTRLRNGRMQYALRAAEAEGKEHTGGTKNGGKVNA